MDEDDSPQRNSDSALVAIHVEVLQSSSSSATTKDVETCIRELLKQKAAVYNNYVYQWCHFTNQFVREHVEKITILATGCPANERIMVTDEFLKCCHIHVYRVLSDDPWNEDLENDYGTQDCAGRHWALPNLEFEGVWENLIFDSDIKEQMLSYAESMLFFADKKVDPHVISCNRMLLFHGPPGTGKTTLCKAIAQKLCIRMSKRYRRGRFLEINSHSLFSKWFSESSKLVTKLFAKVHEILEEESSLLVILIDEVESLTVARKQALSRNEPSDAVRVVNALLTQIDYIRRWPNILVLTTSNLAEAVDPAFLDRADIKLYIGPPSPGAIYKIFYAAILELRKTGIINAATVTLLPTFGAVIGDVETDACRLSKKLFHIAQYCIGFSGRTIRKLPMLAHAFKLQSHKSVSLEEFVDALAYAASKHLENTRMNSENGGVASACNGALP